MSVSDIDFEGNSKPVNNATEENVTPLNGNNETTPVDEGSAKEEKPVEKEVNNLSTGELEVGTQIEFDGATYTVAENGDLVDSDNKVFKPAAEVNDWMKSLDVEDNDTDDLNIDNIIDTVGTSITDEQGNAVVFDNTPSGVKAYLDSVMELRTKDIQEATVTKLFDDMPILKDFANYVIANGGDYRGFGEMPDRSGIEVDENNVEQQKAIVRASYTEKGKGNDIDRYIKYLEDTGQLLSAAREELQALKDSDAANKQDIERRAAEAREQEQQAEAAYWNDVRKTIDSRIVMGYKLPEHIIVNNDGKKVSKNLNDFFEYISRPIDNNTGATAYQKDLAKVTKEDALAKDILDAYLTFTGGSYKDLINMAVKEEQVKKLVLKAKSAKTNKSVKVVKPNSGKGNIDDIVL